MISFARPPRSSSPITWMLSSSYVGSPVSTMSSQYYISNNGSMDSGAKMSSSGLTVSALPSQYFMSIENVPNFASSVSFETGASMLSSEYCISPENNSIISPFSSMPTMSELPMQLFASNDGIADCSRMSSNYSMDELLTDTEAEDVQSVLKQLEALDYDSHVSTMPSLSDDDDDFNVMEPCPNGCSIQSKLDYLNVAGDAAKLKAHRKLSAELVLIAPRIQKVEYVRATRGWSAKCKFQPRERRARAKLVRYHAASEFKPSEYQRMLVLDDPYPDTDDMSKQPPVQ